MLFRSAISRFALLGLPCACGLTFTSRPSQTPAATREASAAAVRTHVNHRLSSTNAATPTPVESAFSRLPALRIEYATTGEVLQTRLYDREGAVDEAAAEKLDALLCDARDPQDRHVTKLNRRTLQLVFRAAYHFGAGELTVVSAYRKPGRRGEGLHGHGSAIDFRLRGVTAAELAQYLRGSPRTGVGVYTHPKTQYVHLDARERSYHWLDASPPRRRWREKSIGKSDLALRDASYAPDMDLPDAALRISSAPALTAASAR